jgi:hypothetical protein
MIIMFFIDDINDRFKGKWLGRCQFRQDFSIQVNITRLECGYESGITPLILSYSRLKPLNPQFAPIASLRLAIAIRVLPRLFDPSNGNPKAIFGTSSIALGVF